MAWQTPTVTVTVNSKKYTVDPDKMPYFNSQADANHDIKHFDVALLCVKDGYHQAFESFKTELDSYPALCTTLKRLGVHVLGNLSLSEVTDGFKRFDSNNEAADSVFKLLYMHHTGALQPGDRNRVFDGVIYIISHHYFFNHYTRNVVRETYKTMGPTVKQLAIIEKWPVYDSDGKPTEAPSFGRGDDDYYDNYDDPESEAYFQTWGHY